MSSASSHSEVISRKPSGSCLIHPSISSSSSDYDQGEEFDLLSESLKEPKPEDLLVRPKRPQCLQNDPNPSPLKRKVYYTFENGPVYFVYPVHLSIFHPSFCSLTPQPSSMSLPSNLLWKFSLSKSKKKSKTNLSSNAFSHSFSPNQTDHCEWLPQDREFYVCVQKGGPHQACRV